MEASPSLTISLTLPVCWRAGPAPAGNDGVLLLRVLSLLEAASPLPADEHDANALRWQALEARVDICLLMLGQLLQQNHPAPPASALQLSSQGASWLADCAVPAGEAGVLGLYLSPRLPQPLWLPGHIVTSQPTAEGVQLQAAFDIHDSELQDWLDKTIFRRHRREIAERRHHTS